MAYFWVKSLHLLFVVAWLASVFYLPRILLNINECAGQPTVQERLVLMGKRLYRFGHVMFGFAFIFGMTLWLHFGMKGGWLHAKLLLVALLFAYFIATGVMLKKSAVGDKLMSTTALRWYNELPILLALGAIYLVIAKPF
ncbi:MAG TPA: CopD family protein [Arenimonas sp.]|nr:CopD family protein [Arenimonas sp.]HOZ06380.1 CopD family protein [Arenimonas sp.]